MKAPVNQVRGKNGAVATLPPRYVQVREINLQADTRLGVFLNLASVGLLLVFAAINFQLLRWIRPAVPLIPAEFEFGLLEGLRWIVAVLAVSMVMITVHEALHGLFFRIATQTRPKYAFKGVYAYAAAPGWYFDRSSYLKSCLAPFVVISLACLLLFAIAPAAWLLPVFYLMIANAAGSTADLYVALVCKAQPAHALYQDLGDRFLIYHLE
ncbi:MAG: DUF3267 domain-containing protein [Anaerolineae bacterium]|nr:DUF3267 domain-containing protein [Anaerolineae bacterium]